MTLILLYLLRIDLWPQIWLILVNFLYALEKNIFLLLVHFSCVFCSYDSFSILDLWVYCQYQIWKNLATISLNIPIFPLFPSGNSSYMYVKLLQVFPEFTHGIFILFPLWFILDSFYYVSSSSLISYVLSDLPSVLSNAFFILDIILFICRSWI